MNNDNYNGFNDQSPEPLPPYAESTPPQQSPTNSTPPTGYPPAPGAYPPPPNSQQFEFYNPSYPGQPPIPPNQNNDPYRWDYNNFENYNKVPKKKHNKGLIAFLIALGSCVLIGIIAVVSVALLGPTPVDGTQGNIPYSDPGTPSNPRTPGGEKPPVIGGGKENTTRPTVVVPETGERLSIPEVAAKVTPSVVGILRYENTLYEPTGLGSGIIISADDNGYSYILTNSHVVQYGTNFKVGLHDGTYCDAELVGADSQSDLAVLQVQEKGLVPAEIGDSNQLVVGETVVAIGNPVSLELSSSVTMGIVSAVDRTFDDTSAVDYIQTDAAINPGNSGGALANEYGQVVGVNTMKVRGVGYEGIGFSIPMNTALPIINELIEHGKVASRPALGITGMEVNEMKAKQLDCPVGIMVVDVSEDSDFEPELEPQDIITHINGERIMGLSDLRGALNDHKVGDTVELTVYRMINTVKSEEVTVTATLVSAE